MWEKLKNLFKKTFDPLREKREKGKFLQKIYPNFSYCLRCLHPWCCCKQEKVHSVYYKAGSGHFALCKECWEESTTEEKIFYYTQIDYIKNVPEHKKTIITNILKECDENPEIYFREKKLKRLCK